jgi:hypothetical protein
MKMIKEALEFGASVDSKSIYDWLNNQPVNWILKGNLLWEM